MFTLDFRVLTISTFGPILLVSVYINCYTILQEINKHKPNIPFRKLHLVFNKDYNHCPLYMVVHFKRGKVFLLLYISTYGLVKTMAGVLQNTRVN